LGHWRAKRKGKSKGKRKGPRGLGAGPFVIDGPRR
jgi:hypothetical protein